MAERDSGFDNDLTRLPGDEDSRRLTSTRPSQPSTDSETILQRSGGDQAPVSPGGPGEGPLAPGQPFGSRYQIISLMGAGGMGAVYKAWDEELGVVVALKVIRPEAIADPDVARAVEKRFKQELLLARQVTHRNVVRIHDLGSVQGIKYMTMPLVEGDDLGAILAREGALPVARVMKIARTLVSGLTAAHHAGVVHRDLKPANVMINADGEALIMDFGIALSATQMHRPSQSAAGMPAALARARDTVEGSVVGTIEYMAPEQARAEHVDQRADIYAVGLILYDLLGGRKRLERTDSAVQELSTRMQAAPAPLRQINPAVPEPLERVIGRCLQPDASARFPTTDDLQRELGRLDDAGKLRPVEHKITKRTVAAAACVLLALVTLTWWFAASRTPPAQPKPVSVLIADADNRTGLPVFSGSLEQALRISLEGASFINAFPRAKAREIAAQNITKSADLPETVARLVARREMIDIVVASTIERKGVGFELTLRALPGGADPGHDAPIAVSTATAADPTRALEAVNRAAADLRRRLGDRADEKGRMAAADVFTTTSLESLKTYAKAQELQASGGKPAAFEEFNRALQQDPEFALAYSGAAVMAWETGRTQEAHELWRKMLLRMDHMTERERYRALGTYYLGEAANYDKAVENYSAMVQRFPSDRYARSNLALAYFYTLNMPRALEEGRRAVELDSRNVLIRSNYALYAMYAGDFDTASKEAEVVVKQEPRAYLGYVPLAIAAIAHGDFQAARQQYGRMAETGAPGLSLAQMGLADLQMYQGRAAAAKAILIDGISVDTKSGNTAGAAEKHVALAEAYAAHGERAAALKSVEDALRIEKDSVQVDVPAATMLVDLGRGREARAIAARLQQQLQPQLRAYGRTVEGRIAFVEGRMADAVDALGGATKLSNLWLPRFYLGIAYVHSGHYAEGLAELDACRKRRGEATALFLNEVPTFRYMAALSYWLARAYDGVGNVAAARQNYEMYLGLRREATDDPLAGDARARLAALKHQSPRE